MRAQACAAALVMAAALGGCGRRSVAKEPAAPAARAPAPAAVPGAVAKMVAGADLARDPQHRERALALLREASALDPQLWEAQYDLGVLLAQGGDLASAEPPLERALTLAPDVEEIALALGQVRRRRGENALAARGLAAFVVGHPDAPRARYLYIAALRDSRQPEVALAQARELVRQRPGDATALSELALCELARGERDQAELLVKEALARDKDSAPAHRASGLIALARGDDALAFAAFVKASQLDPRDTTARLNIGTVLLRAGVYGKAEEQFRAVLAVANDDGDAQLGLAVALRGQADKDHRGRLVEAERVLQAVLAREPHRIEAQFNLAVLLADFAKRPAEARPLFQRFLADAPSDHPARGEADRQLKILGAR
jgi:tetratricopeptide (TPR) repeat protein